MRDRHNTPFDGHGTCSGEHCPPATEAILTRLGVEQDDIGGNTIVLQTAAEDRNGETTGGGVAGSIGSRASHCGRAYWESLARGHNLVALVFACDGHSRAVVGCGDGEGDRSAICRRGTTILRRSVDA